MNRTAVLLSAGLDSAVLAASEARTSEVRPIYVSAGLSWEESERAALDRLLAVPPLRGRVAPLAQLSFTVRDLYPPTHWALRGEPPVAPTLLPSPALQARRGILNTALTFKLQRDPSRGLLLNDRIYRRLKHQLPPDRSRRRLWHAYRDARDGIRMTVRPWLERVRCRAGWRTLRCSQRRSS